MARGESRGHSAMGHAALQPFTLECVGWRDIHARRSSSVVRHWPLVRHASASAVLGLDKLPTPHLLLRHRHQTKAPREGQVAGDPSVSDPFIQHSLAPDTHPPAQLLPSRIPHRASRVRHPASGIQHPASSIGFQQATSRPVGPIPVSAGLLQCIANAFASACARGRRKQCQVLEQRPRRAGDGSKWSDDVRRCTSWQRECRARLVEDERCPSFPQPADLVLVQAFH